jgi:PAT family beta-lactamase induction signal transducer AmpG
VRFGETTRSRLVLFGGLYFAQGVPWGFVTVALVLRLTGLGMGPAAIGGMVATAQLPWMAKPLVGPLVDWMAFGRVTSGRWGRRRPLLLGAQAAMAVSLLVLAGLSPATAPLAFTAVLLAHNAFTALQDVATDALAFDLLAGTERGRANGVMFGAKYAGTLVGGPGLAWVASAAGWGTACAAAVALLLLPAALVLRTREPPALAVRPRLGREALRTFLLPITALLALFALVAGASDQFLYPMIIPLLRRTLALSDDRISVVVTLAALGSVAGALAGGALADRLGRRRTIALGAVALALCHAAFAAAAPAWPRLPVILLYDLASALAGGILYAATVALFMDATNPRLAATQFQIYVSLLSVRSAWASLAGGRLGETLPAPAMFILAAALELLPLLLLPLLTPRPAAEGGSILAPP